MTRKKSRRTENSTINQKAKDRKRCGDNSHFHALRIEPTHGRQNIFLNDSVWAYLERIKVYIAVSSASYLLQNWAMACMGVGRGLKGLGDLCDRQKTFFFFWLCKSVNRLHSVGETSFQHLYGVWGRAACRPREEPIIYIQLVDRNITKSLTVNNWSQSSGTCSAQ